MTRGLIVDLAFLEKTKRSYDKQSVPRLVQIVFEKTKGPLRGPMGLKVEQVVLE